MKRSNVWFIITGMIVVTMMGAQGAFGAAKTWDGDAGDGLWSSAANWDGDALPTTTADDITFPDLDYGGATPQPVMDIAAFTCTGIAFTPGTASCTLTINGGGVLTVGAGNNITSTGTVGATITGGGGITAAGALTIDNDDATGLTISCNNITGTGAGLITLSGSENIDVSAVITDGAATPLTVNMDATDDVVTLGGANTHTGATTLTQGTLNINGVNVGASDFTVNGGILAGTGTIPGAVTMNAGTILAPGGANGDNVGTITISGDIVFNGASIYRVTVTGGASDLINGGGVITATASAPTVEIQAGYSIVGLALNTPLMTFTGAYTAFDESNLPAGFDIDDAKSGNDIRFTALPAPPAPAVPTLNEWGLIIASFLLLLTAFKFMRKQSFGGNIAC